VPIAGHFNPDVLRLKSGHGRSHHQMLGGAIDLDGDMLLPHLLLHLLHLPSLTYVHKNVVLRYTITIVVYPKNHQRSSDFCITNQSQSRRAHMFLRTKKFSPVPIDAAESSRDADRTGDIEALRQRRETCCYNNRSPTGTPTGGTAQVPGVVGSPKEGIIGLPVTGIERHVGLAEQDPVCGEEPP